MNKKFDDWLEQQLGLKAGTPTYPAVDSMPVEDARKKVDQVFEDFIVEDEAWNEEHNPPEEDEDPFSDFGAEHIVKVTPDDPPVHAAGIPTGVGKTQRGIVKLAEYIKACRAAGDMRSRLYLVPRHWLGEDIDGQVRTLGLTAKVYRGLSASDPSISGNMDLPKEKQEQMCLAREKRELAEILHKPVSQSCCKFKKERCEFHPEGRGRRKCGYQQQQLGEQPDVWIAAHNMLFHPQKAFGEIPGIVIDEGFVIKSGVYGIGSKKKKDEIPGMLLDDLALDDCPWRKELIEALREHPLGGLRADLVDFIATIATPLKYYTTKEWDIVNSLKLTPEMSPAQIKEIRESEQAAKCRRARWMAGTWPALFELLSNDMKKNFEIKESETNKRLMLAERKKEGKVEVSGRLVLAKNKAGKLVLQRRGIRPVVKSRKVPTFLMDATMPDAAILRVFFPQIREEDITRIDVNMPEHVHITQVLGAPTSELKLWGRGEEAKGKNREDVKRFILRWWHEDDRRSMLVVCQQKYERWLRDNLPKEIVLPRRFKGEVPREDKVIAFAHYNDISGIDRFKNVSSILLVGRIQPSPESVEAYAGALTGTEPEVKIPPPEPGKPRNWFESVPRSIRMKDGSGIEVERCDFHPEPMCEAVRLLLCEGEMIQALGRARAINRDTPEKALKVGILANVVLDLTVDSVQRWEAPSELVEPLALDSLVPNSPWDMMAGWPHIWKTVESARHTWKKVQGAARAGTPGVFPSRNILLEKTPGVLLDAVSYRRRGPKQKNRWALLDQTVADAGKQIAEKLKGAFAAISRFHMLWPRQIKPLAGAGKVVVDTILRRARYPLSADWKHHKAYTGTGRPGRYVLSKDPQAMAAYDGLPLELRMRALGLHENAIVCNKSQQTL